MVILAVTWYYILELFEQLFLVLIDFSRTWNLEVIHGSHLYIKVDCFLCIFLFQFLACFQLLARRLMHRYIWWKAGYCKSCNIFPATCSTSDKKKRKIIIVIRVKVIIIMIMLRGRKAVECNNKSWRHICGCFSQKRKVAIFLLIVIVIIIIIMMITNINGSSS